MLTVRAKFKKFPSQAAAQEFMEGSVGPYAPPNHAQTPSARTSQPDDPFRASSPPTAIDPSLLPSNLQELSRKGYTFSKDQRLVVYTDGSGLGNGQVGAKAGLGVFWGRDGEAGARNLSERVPGKLQTNNRGELLVSLPTPEVCSADTPVCHTSCRVVSVPFNTPGNTDRLSIYDFMSAFPNVNNTRDS